MMMTGSVSTTTSPASPPSSSGPGCSAWWAAPCWWPAAASSSGTRAAPSGRPPPSRRWAANIFSHYRNIFRAPQYLQGLRDVLVPETMDVVFDENNGALVVVRGALHIQVT